MFLKIFFTSGYFGHRAFLRWNIFYFYSGDIDIFFEGICTRGIFLTLKHFPTGEIFRRDVFNLGIFSNWISFCGIFFDGMFFNGTFSSKKKIFNF